MTVIRRSKSASVISVLRATEERRKVGFQRQRRSRARQWGRSSEKAGVRLLRYLLGALEGQCGGERFAEKRAVDGGVMEEAMEVEDKGRKG